MRRFHDDGSGTVTNRACARTAIGCHDRAASIRPEGGHEALLKATAEKQQTKLNDAAGKNAYQLVVTLDALDKTDKTACRLGSSIEALPSHDVRGMVSSGATAEGIDDTAANDCIESVVEDLLGKVSSTLAHPN